MTTGALSLDPVDVDLGHGLRFARHYASTFTDTTQMGAAWRHSLEWKLQRITLAGTASVYILRQPLQNPITFSYNGSTFTTNLVTAGQMTSDAGGFHFTSASGTQADFDTSYRVTAIRIPSELPISVTYGTNSVTYSNGISSIALTLYPSGDPNAGLVASVAAGGETWTYTYGAGKLLASVLGPDASTPSPSDTVTWTYTYSGTLLTRVDRTSGAGTTTLGQWAFTSSRVTTANEQALEQPLSVSYYVPAAGKVKATVKNASGQVLALFDSTNGAVTSVTNTTGPAAPVAGGAGVPVPFKAVTFTNNYSYLNKTQTDQNGNITLYENYDDTAVPAVS
jgi:YD repeat-containing protein